MKKIVAAALVVLLALVAVSLIFFRNEHFEYSGVIEAVEVDIPSRLSDVISKLHADEGDDVKAGQIIAELECKQVSLQEDIAFKEYKRAENLLKTNAGSKENYDLKKNRHEQAALAKSWCVVASPIDGKILYKYYEAGEFAAAGRKIATVADLKNIDAIVYVEYELLSKLSPGQKVIGYLPEAEKNFEGKILMINDEAEFTPKNAQTRKERQRLVFGIKTRFENDEVLTLKPAMTLTIKFDFGK
ncbi:MAG: HlyD family efflux transporter periplasmic adaptor subunit [Elusimicrobiota bacterium]|jgi:HlyD family secretion protein|nr:HlyD family efflux transporter periplasmic adaptor subunit [Elusimicrobiota bacterium]